MSNKKNYCMTPAVFLRLNMLGLLSLSIILLYVFFEQFISGDQPCPLCRMQRAGLIASGFGLALNLRFGPRPSHYAIVTIGALAGAVAAAAQVLLHIAPGTGSYGQPLFGVHLYTLALIAFVAIIASSAIMLLADSQFSDSSNSEPSQLKAMPLCVFVLFMFVTAANMV